jgi:glycosyltransferase involved in cell wall biosynthesis
VFKPAEDKGAAKEKLGISRNRTVLMLRSTMSEFKGLDIIKAAFFRIKTAGAVTVITVDNKGLLDEFKDKFDIRDYGKQTDEVFMASLYQASDILLIPSRAEAFGMMGIEAMSCGAMALVTEGTALPDTINDPECGIAVSHEAEAYAAELQRLIDNPAEIMERGGEGIKYAKANYNQDDFIIRLAGIYKNVISGFEQKEEYRIVLEQLLKYGYESRRIYRDKIIKSLRSELLRKNGNSVLKGRL